MEEYLNKFKEYIKEKNITLEIKSFEGLVHNSELSAKEAKVSIDKIVKTVLIKDKTGDIYAVIIGGKNKVDYNKIREEYNTSKLELLSAEEVLRHSGYPAGGVPPFGYKAVFLIDDELMKYDEVYAGGGNPQTLIKIKVKEIIRISEPKILNLRRLDTIHPSI